MIMAQNSKSSQIQPKKPLSKNDISYRLKRFCLKCIQQRYLILLALPGFLIILIFQYFPMYGIQIAFKDYKASVGIWNSPWAGLKHFYTFFTNPSTPRLFRNTLILGSMNLAVTFPLPIIMSLLLNELRAVRFKKVVQTISYLPHFISVVVIVGMLNKLCSVDGILNQIRVFFGMKAIPLLGELSMFRPLYVLTSVWQGLGWGTIIYLAALAGVDPELYDAAAIDGANRWHKAVHISWQTIKPTTVVLLIMNLGNVLGSDFLKILLMENASVREVSDVFSTFIYREGILGARFEYTTAVGLFQSIIAFILVYSANFISGKVSENSLW